MRSLTRKVLMVLAGALACRIALGQDAPARTFVYDVASVKVDNSGSNSRHTSTTYDHFETTNSSLKQMMAIAYGVREDLISGVPEALDSARFDVLAKILDPDEKAWNKMPQEQRRAVLRPLLEGRFSIKLHWETKQLPVYELRMLPGGVKFKATSEENAHAGSSSHISGHDNSMEMKATASSVAELAHQFADDLQRTVIDKTGLTGKYACPCMFFFEA